MEDRRKDKEYRIKNMQNHAGFSETSGSMLPDVSERSSSGSRL